VSGTLNLADTTKVGKVGGIIGHVDTDATGAATDMLAENCLVALSAINVPKGKDVIAHRVIGFSSGDDYEYDWDNVDWGKPQSEWPRAYFAPEKNFKNNYVISDLAPVDATVQLTDTTTEGADLSATAFLPEWCAEHSFKFGSDVTAPWVWNEGYLTLWFESELSTGVEDIFGGNCDDILGGENQAAKKLIINGQLYVLRHDGLYNTTGARVK
jgi:hypothetical protein